MRMRSSGRYHLVAFVALILYALGTQLGVPNRSQSSSPSSSRLSGTITVKKTTIASPLSSFSPLLGGGRQKQQQPKEPQKLLLPLQILRNYQAQHSHRSLLAEQHNNDDDNDEQIQDRFTQRTFAVGYYSCPWQAGNRLHHFFNAFLWAVVTNRTLLWKYYDAKTCRVASRGLYDSTICVMAQKYEQQYSDAVADQACQALQRASWIPSLDEWMPVIQAAHSNHHRHIMGNNNNNHTNTTVIATEPLTFQQLSLWSTSMPPPRWPNGTARVRNSKAWWRPQDEQLVGIDNVTNHHYLYRSGPKNSMIMVDFFPMLGQGAGSNFVLEENRNYLLHTPRARQVARDLLSEGVDFVYGMLFRELFPFHPSVLPQTPSPYYPLYDDNTFHKSNTTASTIFSIALHVRHSKSHDDGSNIAAPVACLEELLQHRTKHDSQQCIVFLLSDRPNTLSQLQEYVRSRNSTRGPLTAPLNHPSSLSSVASNQSSNLVSSSSLLPPCIPVVAHHEWGMHLRKEHGPFAGNDFFRDLALASQARHGFAGSTQRSSSQLLLELIEYDRRIQAWRDGDGFGSTYPPPKLPICKLPK